MDCRIAANRRFLTDLFAGPFPGHAVIMNPLPVPWDLPGDVSCSPEPVARWLDLSLRRYEAELTMLEAVPHDGVPVARIPTGTQLFAAAFGCNVHIYPDSPACALPLVETADEADALLAPSLSAPPLARVFELGRLLRERLGPDVPINVPDMQSPFDIAALVWRKEALYMALVDSPDAVRRLVERCRRLLTDFLQAFMREFGECCLAHCPNAWAPPELGCWLSEDEAGCMSTAMFQEFCIPPLTEMSHTFGGMFVHCCATADYQYESLKRIPNLRGMNRVFQSPGPRPAIEAFTPDTVLMVAWTDESGCASMLDMALPETRFLFNMDAPTHDDAKALFARMRERCPRSG